ncbi:CoA-binding protein [Calderihabitans maritimus]|uniref:CoA-binding protein n=1 Tax=Calderihabitans maritimus TaxID=1246530 RepID=A0A1Z5HWM2_9FIRM|nr:CoA-binding protein [Calderihabitans maritimus]GAW93731.1 CoA-binding protein [Calderihabitans maritimus]
MDFNRFKTIAVVGLSAKEDRPSYQVAKYLQEEGFRVIPVNPTVDQVLGEKSYSSLLDIPADIEVDIVDIFRKPEAVGPIVEEAITRGAKMVWMQEGVVNEEAARKARENGLEVVMDKCIMKEHRRWRNKQ